ncbi:peptidase S9 [Pedobacter yulinensis]|uniref:Peptidase S9 n=1 Tax=Pedobacter yulinensis TaxID=2126353 RepID=A0A2T3HLT1_9SPHI|nr:prolyl oligopeptidase family serine peptidase [Pedobacter yulinensis]PST83341.1 peptidase S9 [Pedobacter yulinensis]
MRRILLLLCCCLASLAYGQKKPLDHSVYDSWEALGERRLTNDGHWYFYTVTRQQGDAVLYAGSTNGPVKITVPRGADADFSADSKYLAFLIKPHYKDLRQAKIKKKKPADMPKDSLGIVTLGGTAIVKVPRVRTFKFADKGGAFLAYQLEPAADTAKKAPTEDPKKSSGRESSDLVLRNLAAGTLRTFRSVAGYAFSKDGKQLVYAVQGSPKTPEVKAGVFLHNLEKNTARTLVAGKGNFSNFVFDEEGENIAFTGETDPEKKETKNFRIYFAFPGSDTAQVLVEGDMPGIPPKWSVSGEAKIGFSQDGNKLFFGIAPDRKPKDTTIIESEVAKLDIWGYKDDYLQPMQLKNADRESKRSFLSVIDVFNSNPKVIRLTDERLPDAQLADRGNAPFVLASTDFGRRAQQQWLGGTSRDYYLVSTTDGSRKKIIDDLSGSAEVSPNGQYVVYFDRRKGNWYSYIIKTGQVVQLNAGMVEKFADELNDVPDDAQSYGLAAWTEDDRSVLIYDRYDIWSFAPDGKSKPRNLTNGFGRANGLSFRYENRNGRFSRLNLPFGPGSDEDRFLKSKQHIYVSAFSEKTKENGFYRVNTGTAKDPELLLMGKFKYSPLTKAKDAELYLFDKGNYMQSPNLYFTTDLKTETKLSNTNPQQANYNWGTAELVHWTTPKGYKSDGILYKPENFDPLKKYPMIVYFYEKLSETLYSYQPPAPTPSRLNIPFFVSNGYLVFAPDISYEIGQPGPSAVEFINSGVESLKKNSWVDGTKIGIQGQSWGGYQVAYLITQNDMYAAAWAGAPVANMTSAYGGIRWESGMNRQFQYERTQSRIGATLWEKPELYIQNSPLFMLPKVNTPLAIMANDADGAVPWYQGIELFTGLKRLGKPVWLLNYNGEAHNLVERQNRKDIQIREQQFFDYYLKGAKAPLWMTGGIPATEKGRSWGFELTDDKP